MKDKHTNRIMRIHNEYPPNPNPPLLGLLQRTLKTPNHPRRETLLNIIICIHHLHTRLNSIVQFKPAINRPTDQNPISGLSNRKAQHVT